MMPLLGDIIMAEMSHGDALAIGINSMVFYIPVGGLSWLLAGNKPQNQGNPLAGEWQS